MVGNRGRHSQDQQGKRADAAGQRQVPGGSAPASNKLSTALSTISGTHLQLLGGTWQQQVDAEIAQIRASRKAGAGIREPS